MLKKNCENSKKDSINQDLENVRMHLAKAMKTMRLMPLSAGDKPIGAQAFWVPFHQDQRGWSASGRRAIRQKSSPKQIKHMEYWLDAVLGLDEEMRRIVMARACRISWRRLEEIDGRSHTTLPD